MSTRLTQMAKAGLIERCEGRGYQVPLPCEEEARPAGATPAA